MVTVLMATWQGERFLREQLDSILSQSRPVDRLLISDDGSTDGTLDILREYQREHPQIITVMEQAADATGHATGRMNKIASHLCGAAANFFRLFAEAAEQAVSEGGGDYYFPCDQDDIWKNDKVEKMVCVMQKKEKIMGEKAPILLFSDAKVVDEARFCIADSFFSYQRLNPERTAFGEVLAENPVTGGAAMMNRALLELAAVEPESCVMHDWWLALLASAFGSIFPVKEALYEYRQHGANTLGAVRTGSLQDLKKRAGRSARVAENYRKMFAQADCLLRMYGDRLTSQKQDCLRAYLALPMKNAAGRLLAVRRYHFWKSSLLQTMAMCLTIPRPE